MLFNSHEFIFIYLPIVVLGFYYLARRSHKLAAAWLAAASLFFYGWWNPQFVLLLLSSIVFNYAAGFLLANSRTHRATVVALAVSANLALLGFYKYSNFFISTTNSIAGSSIPLLDIVLPLGISFFTFTQIAFLVDVYRRLVREYDFVHYLLFVTYFPHLIAGPILHHKEMMPQFESTSTYRFSYENFTVGTVIFSIGLFKKVCLADGISGFVAPVFDSGHPVTLPEAWGGALCYSLQLYFDFSGYSDMAIGLSRMFGIILPLNFHSPYKAVNIIEFWRRWHMTLSRFLRDYLYIPLGGNRKGKARRYQNLLITMLLGGLWHGAGWTFVIWGGLHGFYLVVNTAWQTLHASRKRSAFGDALSTLFTFMAVTVAWVFFRSDTVETALRLLRAMFGFDGFVLPHFFLSRGGIVTLWLADHGVRFAESATVLSGAMVGWILFLLLIVWLAPNTQQIMHSFKPALSLPAETATTKLQWGPSRTWLAINVIVAVVAILSVSELSEFIYFRF